MRRAPGGQRLVVGAGVGFGLVLERHVPVAGDDVAAAVDDAHVDAVDRGRAAGTVARRQAGESADADRTQVAGFGVLRGVSWKVYAFGTIGLFGYHFLYFTAFRLSPTAETGLIAYLWPLIITNSVESRPLTVGLQVFSSVEQGVDWSTITAATLMTSAPLLVGFILFQRQFVQSFMRAGIK